MTAGDWKTIGHMVRRCLVLLACIGLGWAPLTEAQPAGKVVRIGVLAVSSWPPFDSFRRGLHDLGYLDGRNVGIEYRWAEGRQDRYPELAAELVRLQPDVIVTWGTPAATAAKRATQTIPIVMAAAADPVGSGLVASLARPGGNVTGLSAHNAELEGKRLQLLQEVVPGLARAAVLSRRRARFMPELRGSAQRLGVQLQPVEVSNVDDLNAAFARMTKERADALIVLPDTVAVLWRTQIANLAAKHRLPAMYLHTEHVHAGGLMAYGPDYHDLFRRAATYVDKILKGARPADLPVEQAVKFELVINVKTARALGLTIPPSLLLRADQIIE
jgi:putative ABC transport system substrate-binding protein